MRKLIFTIYLSLPLFSLMFFAHTAPVLTAGSYDVEFSKVRQLLDPACWMKKQCESGSTKGVLIPSKECDSPLYPADPELAPGLCKSASVAGQKVKLNVPLGDVKEIGDIGELVKVLYRFAVAIAVIIAVIKIVHAGFIYSVSGGSKEIIQSAKEGIGQALVGLFLLLGSYVLLNTVNPDLVNLRPPVIQRYRSQEMIAQDIRFLFLTKLGNNAPDLTSKSAMCGAEWLMRLQGFVKENNKYTDEINGKRLSKVAIPLKCGMLLPTGLGGSGSVCVSTLCPTEDQVCLLNNNITQNMKEEGWCVTGVGAKVIDKGAPGEPWLAKFDTSESCGNWDPPARKTVGVPFRGTAAEVIGISELKDLEIELSGEIGTHCPNLKSGSICYTLTSVGQSIITTPASGQRGLIAQGKVVKSIVQTAQKNVIEVPVQCAPE